MSPAFELRTRWRISSLRQPRRRGSRRCKSVMPLRRHPPATGTLPGSGRPAFQGRYVEHLFFPFKALHDLSAVHESKGGRRGNPEPLRQADALIDIHLVNLQLRLVFQRQPFHRLQKILGRGVGGVSRCIPARAMDAPGSPSLGTRSRLCSSPPPTPERAPSPTDVAT